MSTNSINHSPERATLPSIAQGYEHENMNMPVQDAITQWESRKATTRKHVQSTVAKGNIVRSQLFCLQNDRGLSFLKFFHGHSKIPENTFLNCKTDTAAHCRNCANAYKVWRIVKTEAVQELIDIITLRRLSKHIKNWNNNPCQQR